MARNNSLTDEQRKQMVADYAAGNLVADICEKYKVSKSTLDYWVTKSGVKKRTSRHFNSAISIIPGERMRNCLRCGKPFQPYTFNLSLFRYVCSECWVVTRGFEQPLSFGRRYE
jgi:hypothetical protein